VRRESPVATIGGGRVLVPSAGKLRRPSDRVLALLRQLTSTDPLQRASAAVYFAEHRVKGPDDLARTAGVEQTADVFAQLVASKQVIVLPLSGHRQLYLHAQRLDEYAERVATVLGQWHDQNPLRSQFDRSSLLRQFDDLGDPAIVSAVFERMHRAGRVRLTERSIGLADRGPQLSRGEQELLQQLVEMFRVARFQPPSLKECEQAATKNQKSVRSLVALAASNGDLVEIGDGLYLHAEVESELRRLLTDVFQQRPELTMSEIREILGTSRKYGVPIGEYLDRVGFTQRHGDLRRLSPAKAQATV
jgi:selenocysteine-specific elongation factor